MIRSCLLGCDQPLQQTDIVLPEGPLQICPVCKQLYSSCSREQFETTSLEWDTREGTMPTGKDEQRHRQRMSKLLRQTSRLLQKPLSEAALLDVGCSSGSMLLACRDNGVAVCEGVEPASEAAATAASLGFKVHTGFLQDANYPDNSFDIVTLFEVIEHLPDPLGMASEIHRILKPGGIWLFSTGNGQSWSARIMKSKWNVFSMQQHGGHISFFNPDSVCRLAATKGFSVSKIHAKRIILTEKELVHPLFYYPLKLLSELLAPVAQLTGNGHQMYAFLRKQ